MNPLIPLVMLIGGFGAAVASFWLWEKRGVDPDNRWTGGVAKLGVLVGLMGLLVITPVTMIWFNP